MVLGLGSRSRKDRASAIASQLVDFHIHLHEIKPWPAQIPPLSSPLSSPSSSSSSTTTTSSSKALPQLPSLVLRWNRGDSAVGQSKVINPNFPQSIDGSGKILLDESIRIATAPDRAIAKKARKILPDIELPLVFSLVEAEPLNSRSNPGKRNSLILAQTSLKMESFLSMAMPQAFSISLPVSKKMNKILASASMKEGPRIHFTIDHYKESGHEKDESKTMSGYSSSAGNLSEGFISAAASSASDASSLPPPIDDDDQRDSEPSLLSDDEEDDPGYDRHQEEEEAEEKRGARGRESKRVREDSMEEEEIESFTDDEEDSPPAPPRLPSSRSESALKDAISSRRPNEPPVADHKPTTVDLEEKQPAKADDWMARTIISSPLASPARAAAIAASTAYTPKRSFLARRVKDDASDGEDDLRFSVASRSPLAHASRWHMALKSPLNGNRTTRDMEEITMNANAIGDGSNIGETGNAKGSPATTNGREHNVPTISHIQGNQVESRIQSGKFASLISQAQSNDVARETAESPSIIGMKPGTSHSVSQLSNESFTKVNFEPKMVVKQHADGGRSYENLGKLKVESPDEQFKLMIKSADDTQKQKMPTESEIKNVLKTSLMETHAGEKSPVKTSRSPGPGEDKVFTYKHANKQETVRVSNNLDDERQMQDAKHKVILAETRVQQLEKEVEKLRGELRDVAAIEASLYSATAEHGSSSLKLHAPARRLARMYSYACRHGTEETMARSARNTMAGLVLVARTCGNDVPRLTFWWSNIIVLREIISSNIDSLLQSSITFTEINSETSPNDLKLHRENSFLGDWRDPHTFLAALEQLEGWVYSKVVESIWWQVLIPKMQPPMDDASSDIEQDDAFEKVKDVSKREKSVNPDLEDIKQGSISVEIWKKAFLDAYERLCPVRRLGVECGCLPMLNKMVLEACIVRLDVAMFNAIIRDDDIPADPISDPITDPCVLPIQTDSLSFGLGAQLKNAVSNLSSWLSNLINRDANNSMPDEESEEPERRFVMFPLLKAMGGLLMIPKNMLIDRSLRKEVCSTLTLTFIGRILSKYQPDEFSPDPVSSELLDAINAEIAADKDDGTASLQIAVSPPIAYSRPRASMVKPWIGGQDAMGLLLGRSNSVLRKGHTSDDEIDELESPISWLLENTALQNSNLRINGSRHADAVKDPGMCSRFQLLREVWSSN